MGTRHWVPPERFDEYRLIRPLGQGSMGQVWLAHDTVLDRHVAVKFVSELPDHEAVRQRFLTEARAAARVQHPNIIAIYRVGEIGVRPYLISEYVHGDSLDRIARPVAWPRILDIAIGLARGLAAAHRRNVLHRDLKPANAILSDTGEVKLLDFGLAKLVHAQPSDGSPGEAAANAPCATDESAAPPAGEPDRHRSEAHHSARTIKLIEAGKREPVSCGIALPQLTSVGAVIGSPAYMPPEAWRGEPATPRGDVYSLGALLYELASGGPPHRGDSQDAVRSSAVETDAPPLATAAPRIDPRFAAIVDRCLRREPQLRFASGETVCELLEPLAARDRAVAASLEPAGTRARKVRWWPTGAAAAAVVAAIVAYRGLRAHPPPPPAAAGAPGRCPRGTVLVPGGAFHMGSPDGEGAPDEHPRHAVTLSAYCIDRTEVTVAAYAACVAAGACSPPPMTVNWSSYSGNQLKLFNQACNGSDRPSHPINCVDWVQAAAYCAWRGGRLPTEAEWEYAARGSDGRIHPWGSAPPSARRLNACGSECLAAATGNGTPRRALYDDDDGWPTTAPVGSYPDGASPFDVLDMAGNVWEWTADWYGPYPEAAQTDPRSATTGTSRVSRGGSWTSGGEERARATDRDWLDPKIREAGLGFRCAHAR
jgi:formylglycine-generating enzyme required for sulfatase activity